MSKNKKNIRENFRNNVFERDNNKCKVCGKSEDLDAHHIVDRNEMPNGGYVKENGISLCKLCHEKAEHFHSTGEALPGFSIEELFKLILSSKEIATKKSLALKNG